MLRVLLSMVPQLLILVTQVLLIVLATRAFMLALRVLEPNLYRSNEFLVLAAAHSVRRVTSGAP